MRNELPAIYLDSPYNKRRKRPGQLRASQYGSSPVSPLVSKPNRGRDFTSYKRLDKKERDPNL
jgi:hypothetical protein